MIQVQGLIKTYGDVLALDNVSFQVERGEIVGFLGPNGAGKTTTMRILTGYMPPSAGQVAIAGYDVFADSLEVRRRIGYLPETVPLYTEMSVYGYLDFCAAVRGVRERDDSIVRVLEACDIADVEEVLIGKLSKGYRQRVGLAQALIHDPEVLVLDEPTIGLDPRQILGVRELIQSLAGERTVILSTHILPEVSQLCQRVLIIHDGRIVAEDTPERLTNSLQGGMRVRLQVLSAPEDALARLRALPAVTAASAVGHGVFEISLDVPEAGHDPRTALASLAVTQQWGLVDMRTLSMSLEDIFIQLTTTEPEATENLDEGEVA
jgi:ABC-2 type transport system ATP-binding protein